MPSDVVRIVDYDELPPSVRDIPKDHNPLKDGLLMKHQRKWIADQSPLKLCEKGRRTGITYATALDKAIHAATNASAGGGNVYYIGDTKEKGLEFIGYAAHMARVMAAAMAEGWEGIEVFLFEDQDEHGNSKHINAYRIRFASGHQVVALSSNPANIRGLQGSVIIDEAAFHRDVQAVIDSATALLIWGGSVEIISTHNGVDNPFNQLVHDCRKGLFDFSVHRVEFDEAVENGLYERVCFVKGWKPSKQGKRDWYQRVRGAYGANLDVMAQELDVVPMEGQGVAIPGVVVESCMKEVRPVIRLALPKDFVLKANRYRESYVEGWIEDHIDPLLEELDPDLRHYFGTDYARHADFSIFAPMAVDESLIRRVPFIVEMHCVPTRQQEQILWHIIRRMPNFACGSMDATGSGQTIAEYTADEFGHERIHQIILNDKWYRENMGGFVDAFEDQAIDLPRNANIKSDLRALQRINGVVKLPNLRQADQGSDDLKRHGDAAIALAMGWHATSQDVLPPAAGVSAERQEGIGQELASRARRLRMNPERFSGRVRR